MYMVQCTWCNVHGAMEIRKNHFNRFTHIFSQCYSIKRVHIKLVKFFHHFRLEKHVHKYQIALILVIIRLKVV